MNLCTYIASVAGHYILKCCFFLPLGSPLLLVCLHPSSTPPPDTLPITQQLGTTGSLSQGRDGQQKAGQ